MSPPGQGIYGVTKLGIEFFSIILSEELREYNIAVNCLMPQGAVLTEGMVIAQPTRDRSEMRPPEDMVNAAIFLAAQDASSLTGKALTDHQILRGPFSWRWRRFQGSGN